MSAEDKLQELGITLPEVPVLLGSYIPVRKTGNLVFLSGILPLVKGKLIRTGRVGESVSLNEAQTDARTAAINALSVLRSNIGNLDRVVKCIKMTGYVSSAPDFTEQPKVLNAASDLLFEVFDEAGRHARSAVGVNVLPLNSPVEIELIFEVL
jgi:enamine deaminase RidA (YjgF/YER057c/UK114 family)